MSLASQNEFASQSVAKGAASGLRVPTRRSGFDAAIPTTRLFASILKHRIWLLAVGHGLIFTLAYWTAYLFKFDFDIPEMHISRMWLSLPSVLAIKLYIFWSLGHFHGWWRYVTFSDLMSLLRATAISLFALVLLNHYGLNGALPRSVVIMDSLVAALAIGSLRASWRFFRENDWLSKANYRRAIMVGADHANGVLAHQIHSQRELPYRISGFVDNNLSRHGNRLGESRFSAKSKTLANTPCGLKHAMS